ncbi:fos-related antigen 1-like [Haliotis rubra]|uniref:fos-related antigen 1-like n=1 Tax=Haliotis rubra TaxID=36100 RepID=UPI001EE5AE17|nr:fos-related antigen 1-like [Haliotis rubra]
MRHKGDNSCEIEERLARAAETSLKTKSISPVLREELRLSILNRRHANGQEQLAVEFKEPEKHELTPTEIEKKVRRREQNRRAARRCREKKKRNQEGTFEGLAKVIEENQSLEAEINLLKSQKDAIKTFLDSHGVCGSVKQEAVDIMSSVVAGSADVTGDGPSRGSSVATPSQPYDAPLFVQPDQIVSEVTDSLPQAVVDFCLEHSTKDESLFFDCGSDMRRQTVSVSSVSSEADVFGMESDTDTILTNDQSGLSECSEDEDVFQQSDVWGLTGTHVSLIHDNPSCLSLSSFGALCSQISSDGSDDASYMTYFNLSEP